MQLADPHQRSTCRPSRPSRLCRYATMARTTCRRRALRTAQLGVPALFVAFRRRVRASEGWCAVRCHSSLWSSVRVRLARPCLTQPAPWGKRSFAQTSGQSSYPRETASQDSHTRQRVDPVRSTAKNRRSVAYRVEIALYCSNLDRMCFVPWFTVDTYIIFQRKRRYVHARSSSARARTPCVTARRGPGVQPAARVGAATAPRARAKPKGEQGRGTRATAGLPFHYTRFRYCADTILTKSTSDVPLRPAREPYGAALASAAQELDRPAPTARPQ